MFGVPARVVAVIAIVGGFSTSMVGAKSVSSNEIPYQQQITREFAKDPELDKLGFRLDTTAGTISDCIMSISQSGRYIYEGVKSMETPCGIYIFTEPDKIVDVAFSRLDAPCDGDNLIGVVDGWELNGQYFPSEADHPLPISERTSVFCGHRNVKIYSSSQNVALIQYKIPTIGKGFTVSIRFRKNHQPCNVVASSLDGRVTLKNYGRRVNCTFVAIYPAVIQTVALNVARKTVHGSVIPEPEIGIIHQCNERGFKDEVQIGGTAGLDTSNIEIFETICGVYSHPELSPKTIKCDVTAVRLVSSGLYDNSITITAQPALTGEFLNADFTCGLPVLTEE